MAETIPVLEIFGPTIQGEGMVIGQKTMFIRTAGCDYSCSWCDSAFTWDGSAKNDIIQMDAEQVWAELTRVGGNRFSHVTVSGGNPALLKNLQSVISLLKEKGMEIALETQGSRYQEWFTEIDDLTISPKPPSSGMNRDFDVLSGIFNRLKDAGTLSSASLKVVIFNEEDLAYAKTVHLRYPGIPFYLQVGNDDTATADDEALMKTLMSRYEWLIDQVMQDEQLNRVRVLPQLHTLLWGNKRGV
ncbi:7-carboxy-7-deazaguanine synthase QueE [Bacillus sp. FJAT-42376]|uniref:7-carboxy-7-deazaguanine synthase QueE n=1 Tax=Bacillus sp. FJAT-42376 TaxID=2014076 RepID=UPI000F4F458A|nr:7-carboxy-7-deazaguanine synthase QueE [Bacillus sp. FJAT-42376]AZB42553.1 7-carboxy-7-deazaguanine synthase QueE [Bacillus sp. FJAT-42376]